MQEGQYVSDDSQDAREAENVKMNNKIKREFKRKQTMLANLTFGGLKKKNSSRVSLDMIEVNKKKPYKKLPVYGDQHEIMKNRDTIRGVTRYCS
jgi:hypothetical protein